MTKLDIPWRELERRVIGSVLPQLDSSMLETLRGVVSKLVSKITSDVTERGIDGAIRELAERALQEMRSLSSENGNSNVNTSSTGSHNEGLPDNEGGVIKLKRPRGVLRANSNRRKKMHVSETEKDENSDAYDHTSCAKNHDT